MIYVNCRSFLAWRKLSYSSYYYGVGELESQTYSPFPASHHVALPSVTSRPSLYGTRLFSIYIFADHDPSLQSLPNAALLRLLHLVDILPSHLFFFQDFVVFNCFRSAPLCLYHVCLSWLHCARIFQSSLSIYSHLHYVLAFSLSSRLLNPRLFIQAKMFPSPQQSDLDNHELTD